MNRAILVFIGIACVLAAAAGMINTRSRPQPVTCQPSGCKTGCTNNNCSCDTMSPATCHIRLKPKAASRIAASDNAQTHVPASVPGGPIPFETLQGPGSDDWSPDGAGRPFVLKEDGIYKMWYNANNYSPVSNYWCNNAAIAYAESPDGVNWTDRQIVHARENAASEYLQACDPWIIKDDGIYRMWHNDYYKWVGGDWSTYISMMVSIDGINWAREKEVLAGSGNFSDYDDYATRQPSLIIKPDGTYLMWYTVDQRPKPGSLGPCNIARASSANGAAWTRKQLALERIPDSAQAGVSTPDVIRNNDGTYTMYYTGSSIYRAFSPEGINWTDRKLFLMKNQLDSGVLGISYPYYFKDTDNTEYLYFSFSRPAAGKQGFKEYIGRARLDDIIARLPRPGADAPKEREQNSASSGTDKTKKTQEIKIDDIDSISIVKNDGRNNKLLLKEDRRASFLAEFKEILKREPKYGAMPPPGFTMAPDFTVTLTFKNKSRREFLAYGHGCVLLDTKNNASYQFYMGKTIYDDWLSDKPVK